MKHGTRTSAGEEIIRMEQDERYVREAQNCGKTWLIQKLINEFI